MAPSATMLFLSYHQLHRPTAVVATTTTTTPPRREEEKGAAAPGGFRISVRSLALFQRRPEGKTKTTLHERDAGEEVVSAAATDASKEVERKFEEALRLGCWSS